MRVSYEPDLFRRARRFSSQIEQEIYAFIAAKQSGRHPRRKDKPCGRDRFGNVVCPEQVALGLWHYHLAGQGEPLLVYQVLALDHLYLIDITRHADLFSGHERRWLYERRHLIDWHGQEGLRAEIEREFEPGH